MTFDHKYLVTQSLFCAVRIDIDRKVGPDPLGSATGFFLDFDASPEKVLVLITNKHVFDGEEETTEGLSVDTGPVALSFDARLGFNISSDGTEADLTGNVTRVEIEDVAPLRVDHPDASVDLCAVVIGPTLASLLTPGETKPVVTRLPETEIISDRVLANHAAIEDVYMVGCPRGIWDHVNHLPIIRSGITASHPEVNYLGRPEGLLDIASFPGSSGSPVFLYEKHRERLHDGKFLTKEHTDLLGVVFATEAHVHEGEVRFGRGKLAEARAQTNLPMHLARYVKAREILRLKEAAIERHRALLARPDQRDPDSGTI